MNMLLDSAFHSLAKLMLGLVLVGFLSVLGGVSVAMGLRFRGLRWTWGTVLLLPVLLLGYFSLVAFLLGMGTWTIACVLGMLWQSHDLMAGGDQAEIARTRLGVLQAARQLANRWQATREGRGWVRNGYLEIGQDAQGQPVSIPAGGRSGSHTLILGATGSGKTCGEAWIACRLIEQGHGAIAIDPKGDDMLRQELQNAARQTGAPFLEWTPEGPLAYNPYAHGTDTEIADKALSGETFTEPHYLRQAQRYLGHAVRAMRSAQIPVTAASLMAHMEPARLEQTARSLPEEHASMVRDYLDSMSERQKRELSGVRDRLSILAESDIAPWLSTDGPNGTIGLHAAVKQRAVVYFSLDTDRRALLAKMLSAAIMADLVTLAAHYQHDPIPTVVLIDEFSAMAAEQVSRLFARTRSAGMSLLLATQELADIRTTGDDALRDQVIGNIESLIAYRQNVPDSAELIANIAGTKPTWITTQQAKHGLLGHTLTGRGSRTRGHEYTIHPTHIKQLQTGQAAVITPATNQPPVIAQIHHPNDAHQ